MGKGLANPTDPHHIPIITQPSTSKPQKKQKLKKPKRKDTKIPQSSGPTEAIADEAANEENVTTHSNDLLLSGEDSLKLNDLMEICTKLQQLEKKRGPRTHKLKRLFKVGRSAQVVSSEDEGLGDQEDASKQGRKIADIHQDGEVSLVDKTQERYGDDLAFATGVLDVVTTASVDVSTAIPTENTIVDELTLAQTLMEIKSAKPKVKKVMVEKPV
ncbi:hypothetical protein Tco_1165971 [Tanacetum coccineum]